MGIRHNWEELFSDEKMKTRGNRTKPVPWDGGGGGVEKQERDLGSRQANLLQLNYFGLKRSKVKRLMKH